jgi:hypothetical protein
MNFIERKNTNKKNKKPQLVSWSLDWKSQLP